VARLRSISARDGAALRRPQKVDPRNRRGDALDTFVMLAAQRNAWNDDPATDAGNGTTRLIA